MSSPHPRQIRLTAAHLPDNAPTVAWIQPERHLGAPLRMPKARDPSEQTSALIVIILTSACTIIAILDLVLMAANA